MIVFSRLSNLARWFLIIILGQTGNVFVCQGQIAATVFEEFNQIIINPYLINPSASDTSYSYKIQAANLNELGAFQSVSRFYLDMDKRWGASGSDRCHFAGIQVYNSKFGDYIHKSRLMARYSYYAPLSQKSSISSGISLGFINYSFSTTQGGTGGSDFGPDGSLGIQYLRPNTIVGIAVQQIFTPVFTPVNQSFRLNRLYNLSIIRKINLDPQLTLTAFSVVQYSENTNYNYSFGLMSHISGNVLLGVNNYSLRKTSVNAGVENISFINHLFLLMATYSFHHNSIPLGNNSMEISLSILK